MPGFACLNAGVVRIGRHLAKRRNIMWRLQFDLSREQNSPDQPGKRVQNGPSWDRTRTLLIQSGRPRIRSSGKSLPNREFVTSAAGKKDRKCRGLSGATGTETM